MSDRKKTSALAWRLLFVFLFVVCGAIASLILRALEMQGRNEYWSDSDQAKAALFGMMAGGVCASMLWMVRWCLKWVVRKWF